MGESHTVLKSWINKSTTSNYVEVLTFDFFMRQKILSNASLLFGLFV